MRYRTKHWCVSLTKSDMFQPESLCYLDFLSGHQHLEHELILFFIYLYYVLTVIVIMK